MRVLEIRPLGWARFSATPVAPSEYIGWQRLSGYPQPSTIIGLLGSLVGVVLDGKDVEKDPLLGLGALARELYKRCKGEPLIMGPLVKVKAGAETAYAVFVHSKQGAKLLSIEALSVLKQAVEDGCLDGCNWEKYMLGEAAFNVSPGIALADRDSPSRKVVNLMFRRGFTYYVSKDGGTLDYTLIYYTPCLKGEGLDEHSLARLGGENRHAIVRLREAEDGEEKVFNLLTWLGADLKEGYYLAVSTIPVIPESREPYVEPGQTQGLRKIKQVIGVPSGGSFKPQVVALGLGFSEVAGKRRPMILGLPPGTVVKVGEGEEDDMIKTLWQVGYATIIPLRQPLPTH